MKLSSFHTIYKQTYTHLHAHTYAFTKIHNFTRTPVVGELFLEGCSVRGGDVAVNVREDAQLMARWCYKCVCTCVYICMCVPLYILTHDSDCERGWSANGKVFVYVFVHIWIPIYVCVFIRMHARQWLWERMTSKRQGVWIRVVCVRILTHNACVYAGIHTHTYVRKCVRAYMNTRTYIRSHTHADLYKFFFCSIT